MEAQGKREILAESALFDNLLPVELTTLADLFTVRNYGVGDVIFTEGDLGDSMFIVADGQVEILRKAPMGQFRAIAALDAPQFFGEMSLIDKEFRSATVRAKSKAQVLQLTNEDLHLFAKSHRNGFTWIVVNIARTLSSRLREVNRRLTER